MQSCCNQLETALHDTSNLLEKDEALREYYFHLLNTSPLNEELYFSARSPLQCISFCPFCGTKLPKSLRNTWGALLEASGFSFGDQIIPIEFTTSAWWKKRGL